MNIVVDACDHVAPMIRLDDNITRSKGFDFLHSAPRTQHRQLLAHDGRSPHRVNRAGWMTQWAATPSSTRRAQS